VLLRSNVSGVVAAKPRPALVTAAAAVAIIVRPVHRDLSLRAARRATRADPVEILRAT